MSLPKEPRQKMINMMYLVLTALLALNVSSEILNAFKTVNNSIVKANDVIEDKNKTTYQSLESKLNDETTKEKAKIWKPKADAVKKLSADMFLYLENLKKLVKEEAGLKKKDDGTEEFKEDDLDAATRLMTNRGEGPKLLAKLTEYKTQLLDILSPNNFPDELKNNRDFVNQMTKDIEALKKSLPLNLNVPKSNTDGVATKDWATSYFHMTPTIAAVTILSKFQNDVKNAEAQLADYCHNQVGAVKLVYDKFEPFVGTNATYLMPGQELEIKAGIGAFNAAAKPSITIGGSSIPVDENGVGLYKTTVNGAGSKSVVVSVTYSKPDGTLETLNKTIDYTVGVPSGASIFLEKMNVMYIGVDNPVTISAGSAGREKMNVSFSNGSITNVGGDRYIVKPSSVGPAKIIVNVDGKSTPFEIRCKMLPDPIAMVGGKKGGSIGAAEFKVQGGVLAKLMDSEFDAPFQVVGYKVAANGGNFSVYREATNDGNRWSGQAADIVSKAGPGTTVFFDDIRVKGPDGKVRGLSPLVFQLK